MMQREVISFSIPGAPVPFARARSNGSQRFTAPKQAAYMREVALRGKIAVGPAMFEGPIRMMVRATFSHPDSWSAKKKAETYWKTSRCDLSNIVKLVEDALNGVAYKDDALIVELSAQKVYGSPEGVTVTIATVESVA